MTCNLVYLYLIAPLHTGGTTQEGNLLGIARESHTNLPYAPSSTNRGKLRVSETNNVKRVKLFGPQLEDIKNSEFVQEYEQATGKKLTQLEQGDIWIGDASILWLPVPSLSHGVIWISCPILLERWARFRNMNNHISAEELNNLEYKTNLDVGKPVYLKDAVISANYLKKWNNKDEWKKFVPQSQQTNSIHKILILPDPYCITLIQMSLWRQVKIKLDIHKTVDGGFRYEEAIPPDTVMYFPWGITSQTNGRTNSSTEDFQALIKANSLMQIGGQEGLGRGFVQTWTE
ncbi:type III-B CRISPR module RAMP protein Cmr4 [Rivularia sp. UHCC 0363]|uniref:type III-B CRISPR module RAMP protein Cmr4 n=1 Tax=Rivularia sp. UHCC 0363 TaxID=3110244 RepID=UPI002B213DD4|nr:type III-B CRISPR module RAMP protein Cmr4 [Rivularia sp. UHCC 0363]MEA5594742.1 type III-B CRISPR module RAMP protein Cmr4 [Rivularia sp. UHCC 0363]